MINCQSCQELLPELSMGELEARDRKKVKYHLTKCRACALQLAKYQRVWNSLPLALEPIAPPDTIRVQLMDRVQSTPRVNRSDRRDRVSTSRGRNDSSRLIRYFIAASLLFCLFALSNMNWTGNQSGNHYANQPEVRQQIRSLANSLGRGNQLVDPGSGIPNFVHVKMNNGSAYGSLSTRPSANVVWDRIADKWHLQASNLDDSTVDGDYTFWLGDRDGKWVASTSLVLQKYGNTDAAFSAPVNGFREALITLETDGAATRPSASVVFKASLRTPFANVVLEP